MRNQGLGVGSGRQVSSLARLSCAVIAMAGSCATFAADPVAATPESKPAAGTPANGSNGSGTNGSGTKTNSTTTASNPPLVAGQALPVAQLHIGTDCDPATGKISGDVATRQIQSAGTAFTVYFDKTKLSNAKIDETERTTRLYSDIQAVLSSAAAAPPICEQEKVSKNLQFKRSTVKVTGVDLQGNDAASVTVVAGPVEHAYLGLDLPVTDRKTLKYDTASKSLQPASTSPQLYLSLNWLVGDILSPAQSDLATFYKNFSAKAFVSASSTPLNSYGVGIGYRLPELKAGVFDLSDLSLYGGYFWTKQDAVNGAGTVQTNGGTNRGWRFGVTYDVGAALKWVKW